MAEKSQKFSLYNLKVRCGMDKGIYIDSKGKQHLITRMNFVYLQNAINKLKEVEEIQQLNENHDLVKKRMELEAEYQTRPEYQPPNLPTYVPSQPLPNHHEESGPMPLPPAKRIEREWDIDDDF